MNRIFLPKVSIIIPTYNRKALLDEALKSALGQEYSNLEIIVSDNASTDGTDELMKKCMLDGRIKYHRHDQNIGSVANHQHALYHLATGEYALIMGDDDYLIDSRYISKAVSLIADNPNVVLVHANCRLFNMATNEAWNTDHQVLQITKGIDYFLHYEMPGYPHIVGLVTTLFNRNKAMENGCLYEKSLAFDTLMYLKLMLSGDVGVIHDCVAVYRIHENSTSNHLSLEYDYGTIEELERMSVAALQWGFSSEVMNNWINFQVFKYVHWCFVSYFVNNRQPIAIELLNSIREKYPEAYQAVRKSLNIESGVDTI